jgi:hypothetical protein
MNIIYDTECYPNFWCLVAIFADTDDVYIFEISERHNDILRLMEFFYWVKYRNHRMVGFNNIGYDYPMLHHLINIPDVAAMSGGEIATKMYQRNEAIFNTPWSQRFSTNIPIYNHLLTQLDLCKLHGMDSGEEMTSLKIIEINMKSKDVVDIPIPPGTTLTFARMQIIINYCITDTTETKKFYKHSVKMINFRDVFSKKHDIDYTNLSDVKIGKKFLISELERQIGPNVCFSKRPRKPKQTIRGSMNLKDLIFPYISFKNPEFKNILDRMNSTSITKTKDVLNGFTCEIKGVVYKFGTGGIHAFSKPHHVKSCSRFAIMELDAVSYYSSIAIVNRLFPAHLSEKFCDVYTDLSIQRQSFNKGTPENKVLKDALNGAYGDSNSKFSPFYDPAFTMSITLNGQLLLCLLAEWLMKIPDLSIIHINTDGLAIRVPHILIPMLNRIKNDWQKFTCLSLKQVNFSDMWIKNVNSYIAIDFVGDIRCVGEYKYKRRWSQNHSMLVIRKAAEAHLVRGVDIRDFIENHEDNFDFFLTAKIPRTSRLMWGATQVQNTSRYYISKKGASLLKIMPPLAKNPTKERTIGINVDWLTTICNNSEIDRRNIDYDFYIAETKKLTGIFGN